MVGDSGVGKTSLLVQFDTGRFTTGSFSATVGIGFTVRFRFLFKFRYRFKTLANWFLALVPSPTVHLMSSDTS